MQSSTPALAYSAMMVTWIKGGMYDSFFFSKRALQAGLVFFCANFAGQQRRLHEQICAHESEAALCIDVKQQILP